MCLNCNDSLQVNLPVAPIGATGAPGATGPAGPIGLTGATGPAGTNGTNGVNGNLALKYTFANYSNGSVDPTSGKIALSAPGFASSNVITVSDTDANAVSVGSLLDTIGSSTNPAPKAFIQITKQSDSSTYVIYRVVSKSDAGPYHIFNVVYVASSASVFIPGDSLVFGFNLVGDAGIQGPAGPTGAFMIGTLDPASSSTPATNTIYYPAVGTKGNAYYFTSNGYIQDFGVGSSVPVYVNDVLYCINDTIAVDGTKWMIWGGNRRGFMPGTGTGSYVQTYNALASGLGANITNTTGTASLALNQGGTVNGANSTIAGSNHNVNSTSTNSFVTGATNTVSLVSADYPSVGTSALGSVFVSGYSNLVSGKAHFSLTSGADAVTTAPASFNLGTSKFTTQGDNQFMIMHLTRTTSSSSLNGYLSPIRSTFSGYSNTNDTGIFMPAKSIWSVEGTVNCLNYDQATSSNYLYVTYIFKFIAFCNLSNQVVLQASSGSQFVGGASPSWTQITLGTSSTAGTALTPYLNAYNSTAGQYPTLTIGVNTSSDNRILFNVANPTGGSYTTSTHRWGGHINVQQIGWF